MPRTPIEPPPSPWDFPPASKADEFGVVAIGADLEPGTLLAAYRLGIFPMPIEQSRQIAWWSPDPRGILELDELQISRSLRRSQQRYQVTFNEDFRGVVEQCADPRRDGGWITDDITDAYERLHELGWAHSVEIWDDTGKLVGGLYGIGIGRLFCGESMFSLATDASKVALAALVERLTETGAGLIDVQWETEHLATLGVKSCPRAEYLRRAASLTQGEHCSSLS